MSVERCCVCNVECPTPAGVSTMKYKPPYRRVWCELCIGDMLAPEEKKGRPK